MKAFSQFLVESTLKPGMVFRTKDKTGDLSGVSLYVKAMKGKEVTIVLPDGTETLTTVSILNIDPSSIHQYDPKKDTTLKIEK